MSEFKGTPGEWELRTKPMVRGSKDLYAAIVTSGGTILYDFAVNEPDLDMLHDLRLMAASPKLLAACKEVRDVLRKLPLSDSLDPPDWAIVTLGAAIAAGMGETDEPTE